MFCLPKTAWPPTCDYVAFDLLNPGELFGRRFYRPEAEKSQTGYFVSEPEGLLEALKWSLQFNNPILITENGIEDAGCQLCSLRSMIITCIFGADSRTVSSVDGAITRS